MQIIVRWWPPYTNRYKDQPCEFKQEAFLMSEWFESIGVHANIIELIEIEVLVANVQVQPPAASGASLSNAGLGYAKGK